MSGYVSHFPKPIATRSQSLPCFVCHPLDGRQSVITIFKFFLCWCTDRLSEGNLGDQCNFITHTHLSGLCLAYECVSISTQANKSKEEVIL